MRNNSFILRTKTFRPMKRSKEILSHDICAIWRNFNSLISQPTFGLMRGFSFVWENFLRVFLVFEHRDKAEFFCYKFNWNVTKFLFQREGLLVEYFFDCWLGFASKLFFTKNRITECWLVLLLDKDGWYLFECVARCKIWRPFKFLFEEFIRVVP